MKSSQGFARELLLTLLVSRFSDGDITDLNNAEVIGNALVNRNFQKDDNKVQTIIDPNSNFTKSGYVVGWRFYTHWQSWLTGHVQLSLEVWQCNSTSVCDATVKDITMLTVDKTLANMVVTVPLEKPIAVEAGDCVGYSTRDSLGIIPYDKETNFNIYHKPCSITRNINDKIDIEARLYSYQALVVDNPTVIDIGTEFTAHYYNRKHNIGGGYQTQQFKATNLFQCAAICKREKCLSFAFDKTTKSCRLSEDNGFAYSNIYTDI